MAITGGKLFIARHQSLVGLALLKHYTTQPLWQVITRSKKELGLRDPQATDASFAAEKPEHVILAAGHGGPQFQSAETVGWIEAFLDRHLKAGA